MKTIGRAIEWATRIALAAALIPAILVGFVLVLPATAVHWVVTSQGR